MINNDKKLKNVCKYDKNDYLCSRYEFYALIKHIFD